MGEVMKNTLTVGQKVKFDDEKRFNWIVRAVREQFAILTSSGHYTIIDFERGLRGPDDHHGIGYETDEQIDNAMRSLFGEGDLDQHTEVSHRYRKKLNITGVKDPCKYQLLKMHIDKALKVGHEVAEKVDDGGTANMDAIILCGLKGVRESTLVNAGIPCSKKNGSSGSFWLNVSFNGMGNKRNAGVEVAKTYLKEQGVDCYIHYQMD